MAMQCKVCTSSLQGRIDAALLAGETVASVQRAHPSFTDSAIRRHYRNHVQATIISKVANLPGLDTADLVLRLVQLANDAMGVRNQAVAQRNGSATLRAANAELGILRELIQTLGIDDTDVHVYMQEAQALAGAAGAVAQEHPEFGALLIAELRETSPELASGFEALSAARALPKPEQDPPHDIQDTHSPSPTAPRS
ncbi:hypothetical protein [Pseudoclavibacter terrae]|uniref:Uncharacterized protein n=1 Tax=Pseudoclavibacter terrae TaxID=1530195 RepID=A0A7J5B7T4_9MICO|nr:hypothetical protein [Pseudoclavibacter terrae]KAB1639701.1 hypothetical protein F8O03_05110 [Pseudoclavibacter terrae]